MTRLDSLIADIVAALFTWVLLLTAEFLLLAAAYRFGWWRRGVHEDREAKRARVLAAAEDAVAATVPLPAQRSAVD